MDVAATDVPVNLEMTSVVEDKRDGDGREESVAPPLKKPRFDEEVNRVAEIVLVLSALRRIRGGKIPTELEMDLMLEAKSKLTDMCQDFTPKDIIGRDAIGAVIEDLGLNAKLKDQRLGFRAPKLTISEKLSLGKRKMEESKKHPIVSTTFSSPAHSTSTNNVSMMHQWPNSEMKASTSSVNATGNHFIRDASGITQSRMDRPQFKSDMHTGASQGPAVTTGNYFGNAASWSAQPHSSSTISFGTASSDNKVPVQSLSRVTDPSFRPFMSQTPPGTFQGIKGVNYGQTSSPLGNNHHAEIAKIIHKVLQPRAKQNLLWNPPSREYMSKSIICQMCQGTVNEVETVLICDACEKGYHLKCLQANNMKGVPKSEWHCSRCVQIYNGKPFPPKYGRVMRSATTAKMSSSTSEVQLPAEKRVGKVNVKVNQEAMPHPETAKPTEDTAATDGTVESEDVATNTTVEAEDAAMNQAVDESQGPIGNNAAMNQAVDESQGPIGNNAAMNQAVDESQDAIGNDAAMNQGVDTNNGSQDPIGNDAVDTNNESQDPIGNDAECGDPSELVSDSETLNSPKLENIEDPSKDVSEISVSENSQDKNSKMIAEASLQEENSASQTENSLSESPSLQSNTDQSQPQDTTPNVEEFIQENVTENPEEDKSC